MRQLVGSLLRKAGYQVLEASDGVETLALIPDAGPIALALVDVNMPNLDGISLIRELRATSQTRVVPIVMLTTEVRQEFRDKARQLGATGWIIKPFQPHQLLAVVRRLLS
jgi:two-component system chemotaxis response regulator CheY